MMAVIIKINDLEGLDSMGAEIIPFSAKEN
jgi:hypothetical protein